MAVTDGCELPYGRRESNPSPLEEHSNLPGSCAGVPDQLHSFFAVNSRLFSSLLFFSFLSQFLVEDTPPPLHRNRVSLPSSGSALGTVFDNKRTTPESSHRKPRTEQLKTTHLLPSYSVPETGSPRSRHQQAECLGCSEQNSQQSGLCHGGFKFLKAGCVSHTLSLGLCHQDRCRPLLPNSRRGYYPH